jgi:hypothetical protein
MAAYNSFKMAVSARGDALKRAEPKDITPAAVPAELESMVADLEAAADGGTESFLEVWNGLSKTTRAKVEAVAGLYDRLKDRADKVGGPE